MPDALYLRHLTCIIRGLIRGEEIGGEVEFHTGDEKYTFDKTTTIFVPKGVPHCPFMHNRVDRPFLLVVFALNKRYPSAEDDKEINPEKYNS